MHSCTGLMLLLCFFLTFFFLLLEIEYLVCFKVLQQASLETILKLQMVADWGNASMDIMARIRNEFSRQVPFQIIDLT